MLLQLFDLLHAATCNQHIIHIQSENDGLSITHGLDINTVVQVTSFVTMFEHKLVELQIPLPGCLLETIEAFLQSAVFSLQTRPF